MQIHGETRARSLWKTLADNKKKEASYQDAAFPGDLHGSSPKKTSSHAANLSKSINIEDSRQFEAAVDVRPRSYSAAARSPKAKEKDTSPRGGSGESNDNRKELLHRSLSRRQRDFFTQLPNGEGVVMRRQGPLAPVTNPELEEVLPHILQVGSVNMF